MSERDCPDERAVLWSEHQERLKRERLGSHPSCNDPAHPGCSGCRPRFVRTYCSQCGGEFGPGEHGYSHCEDHT